MTVAEKNLRFTGVVLAGGRSSRMGREKALIEVEGPAEAEGSGDAGSARGRGGQGGRVGRMLWERQYDLLAAAGAVQRLVSARADQRWLSADVARVEDAEPDCGPLAGIAAALARCEGTHLMVLAVDLPRLPVEWLLRLGARCRVGCGAVGRMAGGAGAAAGAPAKAGAFEPLAAVYPVECVARVAEAVARREFSLQKLVGRGVDEGWLLAEPITADERAWFENWNAPGDVAAR